MKSMASFPSTIKNEKHVSKKCLKKETDGTSTERTLQGHKIINYNLIDFNSTRLNEDYQVVCVCI